MDKVRFLSMLILPAILLSGCGKDGIDEVSERIAGQNGDIHFEIGFVPRTRVSTGADFKSAWENGDEIGVFAVAHGVTLASSGNYIHNEKLTYNSADGGSWTQETPLYWLNDGTLLDFYAYYPYDADATDPTAISFHVQSDQSGATGGKSNYSLSDLLTAQSDNNGGGWSKGTTVGLTFSHALSMVQLTIGGAVGVLDTNDEIAVTLPGVKSASVLNLGIPEVTAAGDASNITMYRVEQAGDADYATSFTFRGLVPAQTLDEGSSLFLISNGDLLLSGSALTSAVEMVAGQAEMFTQTIPHPADGTVQPEANSYMVGPNGGAIYIPVSRANTAANPNRNLGAATDGLGGVTADNFTVELVWGDLPVGTDGVLTEIGAKQYLGKGYVYVKPGVAGNAVVCVKVDGTIKWSWHIWVTEPAGQDTDEKSGVTWMDRNLGAAGTAYDADGKNGLFYQWGRKDAFPGSDGTTKNLNQTYYIGGSSTATKENPPTGEYTKLPDMVQNPLNFATNSKTYLGSQNVSGKENNSWGGGVPDVKTLYDPCPPGWRVPKNGEWMNRNWTISTKGFTNAAYGGFYPLAGGRALQMDGSIKVYYVGRYGYYWQASGYKSLNSYSYIMFISYLGDDNYGVFPNNVQSRVSGYSVRCRAE